MQTTQVIGIGDRVAPQPPAWMPDGCTSGVVTSITPRSLLVRFVRDGRAINVRYNFEQLELVEEGGAL